MVSVELSAGFSEFGTHQAKYLTHLRIIGGAWLRQATKNHGHSSKTMEAIAGATDGFG
jgi:hypothetical protein